MRTPIFAAIAVALALLASGCADKRESSSNTPTPPAEPAVKTPGPAAVGAAARRYEVTETLPDRYACAQDSDCGHTSLEAGECCSSPCGLFVGSNAWIAAVGALRDKACAGFDYGMCPRAKCGERGHSCAVCVEGKCEERTGDACGPPSP